MATQDVNNNFGRVYVVFSSDTNQIKPLFYTKSSEEAFEEAEKFLMRRMPDPESSFYTDQKDDRVTLYSRQKNLVVSYDTVIDVAYVHEIDPPGEEYYHESEHYDSDD